MNVFTTYLAPQSLSGVLAVVSPTPPPYRLSNHCYLEGELDGIFPPATKTHLGPA